MPQVQRKKIEEEEEEESRMRVCPERGVLPASRRVPSAHTSLDRREQESGSQVTKRLVNQLLTELDGFEVSKDKMVGSIIIYSIFLVSSSSCFVFIAVLLGFLSTISCAGLCDCSHEPPGHDRQRHAASRPPRQARSEGITKEEGEERRN